MHNLYWRIEHPIDLKSLFIASSNRIKIPYKPSKTLYRLNHTYQVFGVARVSVSHICNINIVIYSYVFSDETPAKMQHFQLYLVSDKLVF